MVAIRTEQVAYRYCVPRGTRYTTRMESTNRRSKVKSSNRDYNQEEALAFLVSFRGRLLVGKALKLYKELDATLPPSLQAISSMRDVDTLLEDYAYTDDESLLEFYLNRERMKNMILPDEKIPELL